METSRIDAEVLIPEIVDSHRRREGDPSSPPILGELDRRTRWAAAVVVVVMALAALAIATAIAAVLVIIAVTTFVAGLVVRLVAAVANRAKI